MTDDAPDNAVDLLALTADIVAAHVSNNDVPVADLPALIASVHASLSGLGDAPAPIVAELAPAVSVRNSVKPEYIVCLEDGKKLKMLKRHLMTHYQLTPEAYRAKWNLPAGYPMVAPNYAEQRRVLAHQIGLGRKPAAPELAPAPEPEPAPEVTPVKAARSPRKKLSVTNS